MNINTKGHIFCYFVLNICMSIYMYLYRTISHTHTFVYIYIWYPPQNLCFTHSLYIWAYTCAFAYCTMLSSQGPGWQRCARRQRPGRAACCAPGGVGEEGGLRRRATIAAGVVDDDSFADHDNVVVYVPNPIKSYGGYVMLCTKPYGSLVPIFCWWLCTKSYGLSEWVLRNIPFFGSYNILL